MLKFAVILEDSLGDRIGVIDKLIPNLWAFLAQFIAFVVLAILITKFAYKPIRKFIQTRQEHVQNEVEEAEKKKMEADQAKLDAEKLLNTSRKEATEILKEAEKQKALDREQHLKELDEELKKKRIQAEKDIELEKNKAVQEVKDQIVDIALLASSSILKKNIDEEDNKKIIDEFVDTL